MKVTVIAIGKMKNSPFAPLFDEYIRRLPFDVKMVEIASPKGNLANLRELECQLLEEAIPNQATIIVLDEKGRQLSSQDFAQKLQQLRSQFHSHICFVIGGADGLTDALRKQAHFVLSFGLMTWPHLFVRVLLAEQIYRAYTITKGHPYHRE